MRAKEYIEINKGKLEFAGQVQAILTHCAKIRTDFSRTIKFYENYLSSVEKIQRYLEKSKLPKIKKESYWKLLHEELQQTIRADKSFSYLYQCVL